MVGWFVAGRLLLPIRQLRETASRITVSDLQERIQGSMTIQRQLLDDVRHELKTPLIIVRSHLELLDSAQQIEVDQARALVLQELDKMVDLVDDIESLADSQQATPKRSETDVAELSSQVFAKARVIAGHAWSLEESIAAVAWIDPARITQAWLQLADNAAKYSPEGTSIALGSRERDGVIELWVADQGPGIPAGLEQRIFERFGRVDTGRGIRGSGLGLAIVAAIARAHGGRATLDTSPDGSRFGIEVPIAAGYSSTVSANGLEAAQLALTGEFDLMLLDVGLPGIDGFEVLRRVREFDDVIPVIMLTARTALVDTVQGLDDGANDYVPKPFKFDELLARVRARLREAGTNLAPQLSAGELTLDLRSRRAAIGDRTVELSAREFALAEEFVRHRDQVLSREQLLSRVWGYDFDPGSNFVDVYVRYLRNKLGAELIDTVRGAGYRLK